jgi:hypothetical protein
VAAVRGGVILPQTKKPAGKTTLEHHCSQAKGFILQLFKNPLAKKLDRMGED